MLSDYLYNVGYVATINDTISPKKRTTTLTITIILLPPLLQHYFNISSSPPGAPTPRVPSCSSTTNNAFAGVEHNKFAEYPLSTHNLTLINIKMDPQKSKTQSFFAIFYLLYVHCTVIIVTIFLQAEQ